MKRNVVLGLLVGAGALSMAVAACQQQPAEEMGQEQAAAESAPQPERTLEVQKLQENLFVLRGGGGGNTAVFVQSDGVTVVDTKNPGWGQVILDQIRQLTDKPVTTIINTHTHGDHVSGNVEFPATVDIVVQENTAANMKRMMTARGTQTERDNPPNIFDQNQGMGLPKRTFQDRMTLGAGDDEIDLYYFGPGHTDGDAWVVFPALSTAHAGDIFAGKQIPLIDSNNGGSALEIGQSLATAHESITGVDTVITGHGPVMTWDDLLEYATFNQEFLEAARAAKEAGQSAEEFVKGWTIPEEYDGYREPQAERLLQNAQIAFSELP